MTMDKHRVTCGELGKGTPGKRLKNAWKATGNNTRLPLRAYARALIKNTEKVGTLTELDIDAANWLGSK